MRDISDEVDFECECNRQFRFLIEVCTTGEGINPDRVVLQKGRRHEDLFEFCMNTTRHVLFSELEEVVHQLQRSYGRGFDWVDESEEDFEDFCGLCYWDDGESVILSGGLREREHVVEEG